MTTSNTPLAPSATENAANDIDKILSQSLKVHNRTLGLLNKILTSTKTPDGTVVAKADILAARPRLSGVPGFIAASQGIVSMLGGSASIAPSRQVTAQATTAAPVQPAATAP